MKRLYRCNKAFLGFNQITNHLRGIHLPSITEIYLQGNWINSFQDLPIMPLVRIINLEENDIQNLHGLKKFAKTLEELVLEGTPLSFENNYRQR